ncbi:hypothetical protein TNCV_1164061 [Trichonephila clavipes]|nr:hypothetical protein TNCV_1164061 [Trichonephila clavipes]
MMADVINAHCGQGPGPAGSYRTAQTKSYNDKTYLPAVVGDNVCPGVDKAKGAFRIFSNGLHFGNKPLHTWQAPSSVRAISMVTPSSDVPRY